MLLLLLASLLSNPLLLQHAAFLLDKRLFLFAHCLTGGLLPIEHTLGVLGKFQLLLGLQLLSFQFLLGIESVQLGVDLLLGHALLDLATFVDQLLLALNLRTHGVETRVLLAERIGLHLELLIEAALHLGLTLSLALCLEGVEALGHGLADLLRRFLLGIELLLILPVLVGEKCGQLGTALLQVGRVLGAHLGNAALHDAVLDFPVGFVLPVRLVSQVAVAGDVGVKSLHFLSKGHLWRELTCS